MQGKNQRADQGGETEALVGSNFQRGDAPDQQ